MHHLILDSGAFISGAKLDRFGPDTVYLTTPRVKAELRDAATRAAVEAFPYEIKTRQVSEAAYKAVTAFAQLTGDIAVLSGTDLEIIALTWMIEKETHDMAHLRTAPRAMDGSASASSAVAADSVTHAPFAATGPALPFHLDGYLDQTPEACTSRVAS